MKRPMLISSIVLTIVCAILILFSKIATSVIILLAVSAFIIYFIKPLNLRQYIIIPTVCISCIISCISFLAYSYTVIEPALKYDGEQQYISGKIITTPRSKDGYTYFDLKTDTVGINKAELKTHVKIKADVNLKIKLYDNISLNKASFYTIKDAKNRTDFTYASDGIILNAQGDSASFLWHNERTPFYYCLRFKEIIGEKITAFMNKNPGGLLKGMLFGDSADIETDTLNSFRSSGIAHLLAVSGLHTSLWCGLLGLLLRLIKIPEKAANIVCIIFLGAFCTISAFTPSVMRASLMMLVVLIAPFFKRKPDPLNSLGFAVTLLLLSNPFIITSVSFRLSVTSTLGVLLSSDFERRIRKGTQKIKSRLLRSFCEYILSSIIISTAAGLFTLPVSAFYFGVFSILSPITNILCVKLAFYGMLSGTAATAIGFINNLYIKKLVILIFDITENILNLVVNISKEISSFEYCTIPIHKKWLFIGLFMMGIILLSGYFIYKRKKNNKLMLITTIIALSALFINISVPILPTTQSNTLTILSSHNNLHLIIRSGTHYMYISNSQQQYPSQIFKYLPKASCEKLDYYVATFLNYNSVTDLEKLSCSVTPKETHITPSIKYLAQSQDITPPENTFIGITGKYCLDSKINIEIVDTYHIKYAIIKGNKKTVFVHLYGDTDFSKVTDTSSGDVFVYNGTLPESTPPSAEKIIINSDSSTISNKALLSLRAENPHTMLTAETGDIQIII